MAEDLNKTGGAPDKPRDPEEFGGTAYFAKQPLPDVPPSKPLQWFLFGALVITGAAYVVGEWNEWTTSQTMAQRRSPLRRLVLSQSEYLAHLKSGDDACAQKHYDQAVAQYRLALESQNTAEGHEHLGQALLKEANPEAALAVVQFQEALKMNPAMISAASGWGLALAAQGKPEEAARVFQDALQHNPESGLLHYHLAMTLLQRQVNAEGRRRVASDAGQTQEAQAAETEAKSLAAEALQHFAKASRNKVDSPAFWCSYGQLLNQEGQYAEAEQCLLRAISEDASLAAAHSQLALAENRLGKLAQAIEHYEKVLTLTPDDPPTLNEMALLYATATNAEVRSPKMAVQLAIRACDATGSQNARYMDTLARSYAEDGDFFQAITWEEKAIHRATQLGEKDLAAELQKRQALYNEHKTP
jgi:tetratricopeptide (TPR) repeat protein